MTTPNSDSPGEPNEIQAATPPLKVPRLASLQHRLQHARDAEGKPRPLIDELLFFLDDPPPGTTDRWQQGAELCEKHGIKTSRMSVWRFYRTEILPWRREQNPPPPAPPPDPEEIARLHDQARHLAAQRALETLNNPALSPSHLIGLIQSDNRRQQVQLARDQFKDRTGYRNHIDRQRFYRCIDKEAEKRVMFPAQIKMMRKFFALLLRVPANTTP